MMNMKKRFTAMMLALLILLSGTAAAEELIIEETDGEEAAAAGEAVTEKDGWHFDARGFLTGENPGSEYLTEDEENGFWQYASRALAVTVTRFRDKNKETGNRIREYCVAEIWASPASPLGVIQ